MIGNGSTYRCHPLNASIRSQTAKVVSVCLTALTHEYQAALSSVNSTEQVLKQLTYHLAGTYLALADCWHEIVGDQEADALAAATALSTAGKLLPAT